MKNRIATLPGTPRRVRIAEPWSTEDKVAFSTKEMDDLLPERMRIEVAGGRSSTASAMRAARVQHELEDVGAAGSPVFLEGGRAALDAELDRQQVLHIAKLPFVRRISRS